MARAVQALVIGAGPGGYVAAIRLGQLGVETVLVDRDKLGGVCLNYGCIPSKALINAANLVHKVRHSEERGITATVEVDFARMQAWRDGVVQKLVNGIAFLCQKNGVEVLKGEAKFRSPTEVEVTTAKGADVFEPEAVIVATGGRPIELKGLEFDHEVVVDSWDMLDRREVPERLLIVGGGITGLEIGTLYAKLGSRVVVVELLEQLIPGLDLDLVRVLEKSLKRLGFEIHVESKVTGLERTEAGAVVTFETPGGVETREADAVFVTVGRRPNVENLGLEAAGVTLDEQGFVKVDESLRTSASHIYAIGDCIGIPYLAHRSSKEGILAAEQIAGMDRSVDWRAMPAAIFTDPEIATVGMSEDEAKAAGRSVKAGKFPFAALGRALTADETEGFVKVVMDADTEEVLGVRIVGPEASDLISEAALALEMGATAEDLALTVHPHPTLPEALMEAAEVALGKAIHVVNR